MKSLTSRTAIIALATIAFASTTSQPLMADSAYGCTFPGELPKKPLLSRSWDANELVMFIREEGSLDVRSSYPDPLLIQPVVTLWGSGGREQMAKLEGKSVQLEPGRYALSRAVINGLFDRLGRQIIVGIGPKIDVLSAETLEHDAPLRFPHGEGVAALTLEFVNAKPQQGDGVNSHKLVIFLRAIGETEKNLR